MGNLSSVIQGSSTGATVVLEKNYVKASDAPGSLWVASGAGITVATETTAINLPENNSKTSAIKIQRASGADYVRYRFILDRADSGKKLKIAWSQIYSGTAGDYTLTVVSYTDSNYSVGASTLATSLSSVPSLTGTFGATFDAPAFSSAPYIEIRINGIAGTAALYLSSVVVGPGALAQSAVVSDWQAITFAAPTNLGTGTATNTAYFMRSGSNMILRLQCIKDGSGGSGAASVTWTMPTGYSINTAVLPTSSKVLGVGSFNGTNYGFRTEVRAVTTTTFSLTKGGAGTLFTGADFTANGDVEMDLVIPIGEWAGNGTVTLSSSAIVEYAYNSSATTTADTTSFASGPQGVLFQAFAPAGTASIAKRVRFQYPIQSDDMIKIEVDNGTGGLRWVDLSERIATFSSNDAGSTYYGFQLSIINSTDVDFNIFSAPYVGSSWNSINTWRWRVRKAKASAPVGIDTSSLSSGGSGFTLSVQNANFTAVKNFQYLVDTSSTAVTATLPAGTTTSAIKFSDDLKTWSSKNLTITPATGERIQGLAINESLICDVSGAVIQLSYDGTRWVIDANTVAGTISISNGPTTTEKNYVLRPDATTATDWVSSNVSLVLAANETSASNLPENATKTTAIKITRVSGTTGYVYYRTVLDTVDLGKKLKLQWNQKYAGAAGDYTIQVFAFSASDYTTGSTQIIPVTSSIPAVNGTFTTTFDASSTLQYLELRIVAAAGTTPLYLSGVLIGPGVTTQSAAVGEWQQWVPNITGSVSNPTRGTNTEFAYWRRVGSEMEVLYEINQTAAGTTGSGTYFWSLPTGFTADGTKISLSLGNNAGHAYVYNGTQEYNGLVSISNTGTSFLVYIQTATNTFGVTSSTTAPFGNTIFRLWCNFRFAVAEWAGSGTVSLGAGSQTEYSFNTGSNTGANTSNTTSFGYGPAGTPVLAYNSTTAGGTTDFRCRFQYPIQSDDIIVVELNNNGAGWFDAQYVSPHMVLNDSYYGILISIVNSTDVTVAFGNQGFRAATATTYAASGQAWSVLTAYRWRVRKSKASAPVGFGLAGTDGSSGLYKPGLAPGIITGATIPSGYIGETIEATASVALSAASNAYQDVTSIPLTAGKWRIDLSMFLSANATNASTRWFTFIGTVTGNDSTGLTNFNRSEFSGNLSNINGSGSVSGYIVNITSTTTYYAKVNMTYTTLGGVSCNGRLTAQRIG